MRRLLIIVGIVLIPAIPIALLLTGVIKKAPTQVSAVTLTMWVPSDAERSAFTPIILSYRSSHPYVTVKVTTVRPENFTERLIQAWAQGKGPDIFFVPSTQIGAMQPYASAMPTNLSIPVVTTKKALFGTQTVISTPVAKAPTVAQLREGYVDAATADIIRDSQVWGLPLAMDTVATYVNKDLLNNAKIFTPAQTWTDLVSQIVQKNLTVIDESGTIVQSGVALGTLNNVPYGTDLLTLLMMQNGSIMVDPTKKQVTFNDPAGLQAVSFFSSFADPKKTSYSWNADQPNARDAFLKGKSAYYFGTYADRQAIAASGLNWTVVPMLHLDARGDKDGLSGGQRFIDTAQFNVGMVSKAATTAKRGTQAWSLLKYFANSSIVPTYLKSTNQLSALKTVLAQQRNDTNKSVFADQILTARTWYRGRDYARATTYLNDMITSVVKDGVNPKTALDLAAKQVETTL